MKSNAAWSRFLGVVAEDEDVRRDLAGLLIHAAPEEVGKQGPGNTSGISFNFG